MEATDPLAIRGFCYIFRLYKPLRINRFTMTTVKKIIFGAFALFGFAIIGVSVWANQELKNLSPDEINEIALTAASPEFLMRGLKKGMTLKDAQDAGIVSSCKSYGSSETTCDLNDETVGGVYALMTYVVFENDEFASFGATFSQKSFSDLSNALNSAYGKTCRFDVKRLQNAFGAEFNSIEASWCFSGGSMHLAERDRDNMRESFLSFSFDKPAEPKKSFSPSNI